MEHKTESYKRSGNLVYIKKPSFEELEYTKELWYDYETMKNIGGVFELNDRKKITFYKKMVNPTDGKNFYCIVYKNDGTPVGEASFHGYDSANKIARLNVKIQSKYRGQGFGSEAARLILEYYFYEFLGEIIVDNKVYTREAENALKKLGFKSTMAGCYKMTKDEFTKKSYFNDKEVAVIAFDGASLSKLGVIVENLKRCSDNGEYAINIDLISKNEKVKSSTGIEFLVEETLSTRKQYNIVVFADGIDISKESEDTKKIFKKLINNAEFVIAMDEAISIPFELAFLKGMNLVLPQSLRERYRTELYNYNLINEDFVDNGKFILLKELKGVVDGSCYLIEKIYGGNL